MSRLLIQEYLNQLRDLRTASGTNRESVVREAFKDLLKGWARSHDLIFIPEYEVETPTKERRYVDGALLHSLRVPFGYWEAKDEKDDLDAEIEFKFRRGYPQDNIIFEDSQQAVLIQDKDEVMRCAVDDVAELEKLLGLFFDYQRPEIAEFRTAVEQFKKDLPAVLTALREMIEDAERTNSGFRSAVQQFLEHAREVINPSLSAADVREMLIQHRACAERGGGALTRHAVTSAALRARTARVGDPNEPAEPRAQLYVWGPTRCIDTWGTHDPEWTAGWRRLAGAHSCARPQGRAPACKIQR